MNSLAQGAGPTLDELQRELHDFLMGGALPAHLISGDAPALGAAVYADGYWLRLVEALEANYEALAAWLGPARFAELGRAYARAWPPRHYSIRWFGAHLPAFLRGSATRFGPAWLPDLAAFEWALSEAFDAADAPIVAASTLRAVPADHWSRLRLCFHPSLRIYALGHDVAVGWRCLVDGERPDDEPAPLAADWVFWRLDLEIFFRRLDVNEARAVRDLHAGQTLGDACDRLARRVPPADVPALIAGYLERWVGAGWLTAFHT